MGVIGRAAEEAQKYSNVGVSSAIGCQQMQPIAPDVPLVDGALMVSHDRLTSLEKGMTSLENRLRRLMSPSPGNNLLPDGEASTVETTIVQEIGFVNNRIGMLGNRIGILLDQLHV